MAYYMFHVKHETYNMQIIQLQRVFKLSVEPFNASKCSCWFLPKVDPWNCDREVQWRVKLVLTSGQLYHQLRHCLHKVGMTHLHQTLQSSLHVGHTNLAGVHHVLAQGGLEAFPQGGTEWSSPRARIHDNRYILMLDLKKWKVEIPIHHVLILEHTFWILCALNWES